MKPVMTQILCLLMCALSGKMEAETSKNNSDFFRHAVYAEAGGAGGYFSLNYERLLKPLKTNLLLLARGGIGTLNRRDYNGKLNPDLLIPLGIHLIYGKKHRIETGVGETITRIVRHSEALQRPKASAGFNTWLYLGYTYRANKPGFMIRIAYTPILELNRYFRHWGGLSLGYTFL